MQQHRSFPQPALGPWCACTHLLTELLVGELLTPFQTTWTLLVLAEGASQPAPQVDLRSSSLKDVCSGSNSFRYSSCIQNPAWYLHPFKHCISYAYVQSHSRKHLSVYLLFKYMNIWVQWKLWLSTLLKWALRELVLKSAEHLDPCEVSEHCWVFIALEMELKCSYMNFASCSYACKTLALFLRMQHKKIIHFEYLRKKSMRC